MNKPMQLIATIELTDTFSGEANYSWVKRKSFNCTGMSDGAIVRKARNLVGIGGIKTVKSEYGEDIRWDFPGQCVVAFLMFEDSNYFMGEIE
jgi:hypothetical protein|tara:strand:- start:296 stop:571 length:276 start_codon:yes stop_codon:yes gene_type:complete